MSPTQSLKRQFLTFCLDEISSYVTFGSFPASAFWINEFWAEHYFWTQIRKEISQDEIRSEESALRERTIKFTISIPSLHYGNIFEYLSLWSEVQFLKIQKSKKIQEIQKPN